MNKILVLLTLALGLILPAVAHADGGDITVPTQVIEARIKAALPAAAKGRSHALRLNNASRVFQIPASADLAAVQVSRMHYDERSGGFNAVLSLPAAGGTREESVTGRIEEIATIPVIAGNLSSGDIIGERDITWIEVPARQVGGHIITVKQDMIGMAARRPLRANSMVRHSDLQRPVAVKRGSIVTMVVATDRITLTAQGQALEDGGIGDRIRVTNTASNSTVIGIVQSPREVRVLSGNRVAEFRR